MNMYFLQFAVDIVGESRHRELNLVRLGTLHFVFVGVEMRKSQRVGKGCGTQCP